ncbi:lipopolysaccharide transport periplasmic protein LptA [Veronia pacifica]|uniref:Lipopolysaccharide export system protein LptA n=1 Tax=Veronia pacifica TaxID=1080227 RepID=A0A1C3ELK4_9GAMM|nr:lipopolysaccharide transport periplasmic protein LptA [Veronia pacifica]ODA34123.1 lipopolysaccharide transport periplasmic protein LptA [Veronia pacifica]
MNRIYSVAFSLILLLGAQSAVAKSTDMQQPILIDADSQFLDLKTGLAVFNDQVYIKQGTIRLFADKVNAQRVTGDSVDAGKKYEFIDAFGEPVKFELTLDDGQKVNGRAKKLHYDVSKGMLKLNDDALVEHQGGSQVESDVIIYDIAKEQVSAGRSTTTLPPQSSSKK